MKRLLLILFIMPFIGFGQSETRIEYWDNGQLQRKSIIKDGVEELKFYDEDGKLLPMEDGC